MFKVLPHWQAPPPQLQRAAPIAPLAIGPLQKIIVVWL
jgi:hypothetical protein